MQKYSEMSKEQLQALKKELDQQYAEIKAQGLALDMSRGKPSVDQLNISMDMMDVLSSSTDLRCETGVDCRNYGVMDGIPEAKRLLGEISEVDPEHIIIYGNSSLKKKCFPTSKEPLIQAIGWKKGTTALIEMNSKMPFGLILELVISKMQNQKSKFAVSSFWRLKMRSLIQKRFGYI